ncbi:MAG TPA: regulatory protein RecX [Steroidobacteraceae bacterium]|nr:regulatory protein RecX [Steroidobacteraceae bacterium]
MRSTRKSAKVDPEHARDPKRVRVAAVSLLARRDFASGELRQKLEADGYDREVVAAAVEELIAGKIVNDARYAENYVAYHAERGQGPLRIAADLRALDLPAEVIQAALDNGPDWRQRAREVRIRRFGLAEPDTWVQKAKQGRFLQYRGFSADHIRAALGPDFDPDA